MKLTDIVLKNLKGTDARREIPDDYLSGLYLIVQPSGAKSWAVRYRHHGASRKHTIGGYPAFNLTQAREAAKKALRTVAEGRDPGRERQEARSDTFSAIAAEFLERHSKRNNRESTTKANETLLRLHILPRWQNRAIQDIRKRDVIALLESVAVEYPIVANRVHAILSKLFSWACSVDIIESNPVRDVKRLSREKSRERILSDDELRRVWIAATKMGDAFAKAVQVLALTGQRRDEVFWMKWSELDFDKRLWSLPGERVKNGTPHTVPLSDPVIAILQTMTRDGEHVFADARGKMPSRARGKERLDKLVGEIEPWRLHDLRRSLASGLARMGVPLQVVEHILNHRSGSLAGVAGIYNRHSYSSEKVEALQRWAGHALSLVEGKPANVVSLRAAVL
jgi:integrase